MASTTGNKTSVPATNPTSGVPFGYLPAFLPGSASLVEQLDRRLLVVLRDGRHLVGVLRSFDQFSNCVLEDTSERRILQTKKNGTVYMDIKLGLFLVRGDSVVLLGEVMDPLPSSSFESSNTHNDSIAESKAVNDNEIHSNTIANSTINKSKTNMRKVSGDEFERLLKDEDQEEYKKSLLKWDFDTDLAV